MVRRMVVGMVALFLVLGGVAHASLVSYWPMETGSGSTVFNAVGGQPDGTLYQMEAGDWIPGARPGSTRALAFDGVNEYADCSTSAALDAVDQHLSVSTWVRTTYSGTWYRSIVSKYGNTGINNFWGLGWHGSNQLCFVIRDNGSPRQDAFAQPTAGWGLDGQWHQIVGVRDKTNSAKVYFFGDGQLLGEATDDVGAVANTRPIQIASHYGGSYVPADVDDVAVWDSSLTPYAIDRMHKGLATPQNAEGATNAILGGNPVLYYRLEERGTGSGTLVADFTGNGHTATTYGNVSLGHGRFLAYDPLNRHATLDGSSDYLRANSALAHTDFAGGGSYSIELWFNPASFHQGDLVALTNVTGDQHGILLELQPGGTIRYLHRVPSGSSGGWNCFSDPASPYALDEWQHLVAVMDGAQDTMLLYLNNLEVGRFTDASILPINYNMNLLLGRLRVGSAVRFFDGSLDEVAFFDYALTPGQVASHYAARYPEPGTLSLLALGGLGLLQRRRRARRGLSA